MREEVLVLPPSAERRKANFCLNKTDESTYNNAGRICVVSEATYVKRSSHHVASLTKDRKFEGEASTLQSISEGKTQKEASRREDLSLLPTSESRRYDTNEEGRTNPSMKSLSVQQTQKERLQGALPLQWGSIKRSRASRGSNHLPKPSNLVDESKTILRETGKGFAVPANRSTTVEDCVRSKDAVSRKRPSACTPPVTTAEDASAFDDSRREKRLRSFDSCRGRRVASVKQSKRDKHLLEHCVTRSSPGKRWESPIEAVGNHENEFGFLTKNQPFPKFVISLSRKEMEDDFLILKGTKLPKRPKHRSRIAERQIIYCTPGIRLCHVSISRYIVKEKKGVKGKSKGLKAMETEETDSE